MVDGSNKKGSSGVKDKYKKTQLMTTVSFVDRQPRHTGVVYSNTPLFQSWWSLSTAIVKGQQ
jgi:hypothetical protein